MNGLKEQIAQYAHALGFSDIRFAAAQGALENAAGRAFPLNVQMPQARCLIVLFLAYSPAAPAPEGAVSLSAYYAASHFSYHAARALTAYLSSCGITAVNAPSLPAKAAALRTGGFIGDNGFYHHPEFGSLVCIQTVLADKIEPDGRPREIGACLHCGACMRACPSGAVGHIQNCLRYHINGPIPEKLRGDVYQLFGCEKCQTACPQNHFSSGEPYTFSLEALLEGRATGGVRALAGPNLVRTARLQSQAALYAANTGQHDLIPQIISLSENAIEPVRTHALWALDRLKSEESS